MVYKTQNNPRIVAFSVSSKQLIQPIHSKEEGKKKGSHSQFHQNNYFNSGSLHVEYYDTGRILSFIKTTTSTNYDKMLIQTTLGSHSQFHQNNRFNKIIEQIRNEYHRSHSQFHQNNRFNQ